MLIFWPLTNIFVILVGDRDNNIIVPLFIKKLFLRVISHHFMKSQDSKNRSNMISQIPEMTASLLPCFTNILFGEMHLIISESLEIPKKNNFKMLILWPLAKIMTFCIQKSLFRKVIKITIILFIISVISKIASWSYYFK